MLFFKDIKAKRMADGDFSTFYETECHICPATLKVIEQMESDPGLKARLLKETGISQEDYEQLLQADHCRPLQVKTLYQRLCPDDGPDPFLTCPRIKKG